MAKYMQELQLWEILLLSLGSILFAALIVGFFIQLKNEKLKLSYAGFFMVPIIMIALPTIKNITLLGDFLKIETLVKTLEENPNNEEAKKELQSVLEHLPQEAQSASLMVAEAKAKTFVKDYEEAEEMVEEVLIKSPENKEAKLTKARIKAAKARDHLMKDPESDDKRQKYLNNVKKLQELGQLKTVDKLYIKEAQKLKLEKNTKVKKGALPPQS